MHVAGRAPCYVATEPPQRNRGEPVQPDQLDREVNRLYWETDGPVTRLADELGISRGTFYNHLHPLPAPGKCHECGAPLFFRTRSTRDSGEAHCEACGNEQPLQPQTSAGDARRLRIEPDDDDGRAASREAGLLSARASWLAADVRDDDHVRTQLLAVAIGAAALGIGILYVTRRR